MRDAIVYSIVAAGGYFLLTDYVRPIWDEVHGGWVYWVCLLTYFALLFLWISRGLRTYSHTRFLTTWKFAFAFLVVSILLHESLVSNGPFGFLWIAPLAISFSLVFVSLRQFARTRKQ